MEEKKSTNLSAPWIEFSHKIEKLFEYDEEVTVEYDNRKKEVKVRVRNVEKAQAIMKILPEKKEFGNETLYVAVIPENSELNSGADIYKKAFLGNPIIASIETIPTIAGNDADYVVFVPWIVQYFNDDISDIHRIRTTLYQDIAKDVFGDSFENTGVFFCTDLVSDEYEG